MKFQEFIEISWKPVIFFFVIGGSFWAGKDELLNSVYRFQQSRDQKIAQQIAIERYENGCVVTVSHATSKPATLVEGIPVYNPANAALFPAGTVVCDIYGNTGYIKKEKLQKEIKFLNKFDFEVGDTIPVISDIKYTGKKPAEFDIEEYQKGYIGRPLNVKQ